MHVQIHTWELAYGCHQQKHIKGEKKETGERLTDGQEDGSLVLCSTDQSKNKPKSIIINEEEYEAKMKCKYEIDCSENLINITRNSQQKTSV